MTESPNGQHPEDLEIDWCSDLLGFKFLLLLLAVGFWVWDGTQNKLANAMFGDKKKVRL